MKKILGIIITLLFFASVTVFTLPMMQDDANGDLTLKEKVEIMAFSFEQALADDPDYSINNWMCYGLGYKLCPNGEWVIRCHCEGGAECWAAWQDFCDDTIN